MNKEVVLNDELLDDFKKNSRQIHDLPFDAKSVVNKSRILIPRLDMLLRLKTIEMIDGFVHKPTIKLSNGKEKRVISKRISIVNLNEELDSLKEEGSKLCVYTFLQEIDPQKHSNILEMVYELRYVNIKESEL